MRQLIVSSGTTDGLRMKKVPFWEVTAYVAAIAVLCLVAADLAASRGLDELRKSVRRPPTPAEIAQAKALPVYGAAAGLPEDFASKDATIEEIRAETEYHVPLPTYLPSGCSQRRTLMGLHEEADLVNLFYTCPLEITMQLGEFPDPEREAEEASKVRRAFVAEVSAAKALVADPAIVNRYYGEGVVVWTKGEVKFSVFGEFPGEELLKVARSLR